ncbi:MAG TPA: MBL fold metallo-hydrolase [Baekduia sp.]|uniref:MBL fold metallo-hydrolase n=1 Tax=Baekduia sp. TaxID=2600305 RepID=UPI002D76A9F6|nr:MBL fold metallo-hydrolase [Baekduia sp.]HET6508566.1 MBL fold metallo-hydrolase [Baekduia sp.]
MDPLEIVALTTGQVRIHDDMHRGRGPGLVRRARILRKGPMGEPLPIHAWLIVHPSEGRILVDTGETQAAKDTSFAEFHVAREDELDHQLRAVAGIAPEQVDRVVLTHVHGDHADGVPHVAHAPLLASAREIAVVGSLAAAATRRFTGQPLPEPFAPRPLPLDGPAVGAFRSSTPLTADGRVIAVPTPGHTPGHLAILVVQPDHHVLISGDACYDLAQLQDLQVDGVSPKESVAKDTMKRILAHAAGHPTVVLPSHDPDSARRLASTEVLRPRPAGAVG